MSEVNKNEDSMLARANSATSTVVEQNAASLPFKAPASMRADSLQASRDVTTSSRDTLPQVNESSVDLSGLSGFASDGSFADDETMSNCSSIASSEIEASIVTSTVKSDFRIDNDPLSKDRAHKRRREEDDDDRKPAARRARLLEKPTTRPRNNGIVAVKAEESDDIFCQAAVSNPDSCGACETCTAPFVCAKCSRCSVELSCVFSPCCSMPESTLRRQKRHAHSITLKDSKLNIQFEKIYGEDGLIDSKLQRNRNFAVTAVKSIAAAKNRAGRKLSKPCGTCSTCTDTSVCGKCQRCRQKRSGTCAFRPCLSFEYKPSTINNLAGEAKSAMKGDERLEEKYEKLYGINGIFASKPTNVDRSRHADTDFSPRKEQLADDYCGTCISCKDPIECGKCFPCEGHHEGRCVFSMCLANNDTKTKLAKSKQQAKSIKGDDQRLRRRFDELYGPAGAFTRKIMSKIEQEDQPDKKLKSRCGVCSLCTEKFMCKRCQVCLGNRDGSCVFLPCLAYEYKDSVLNSFRRQAESVKAGVKKLEDQFERVYGEDGLIVNKDNHIQTFGTVNAPEVAKASSRVHNCHRCSSCCSPITCRICVRCHKVTKCVFSICQNFAYKETRMVMYEKWARQALKKSANKDLKVRFDEIFKKGEKDTIQDHKKAEAPPKTGRASCRECSSCCSPIFCKTCYRCKAKRRCVFDICQNFAYKESRMVKYESWAKEVLAVRKDKKLKMRFDELFVKSASKDPKKQAARSQVPNGTRVFARWHENNRWYYGNIIAQRNSLFDIEFDDGDKRKAVPRHELKICKPGEGMVTDLTVLDEEDACTTICDRNDVGHFLLNKGYHHHWINRNGCAKFAFGRIASCSLINGEVRFSVALDLSVGQLLAFGIRNEAPKSQLSNLEEADAWAGYISFLDQTEGKNFIWSNRSEYCPLKSKPFHRQYTLPTLHSPTQHKSTELIVKGHRLRLKVKESRIPNGGLGLFASAAPIAALDSCQRSRNKALILEEGELIDLGVYAPLRAKDLQSEHVHIVKNFIHNWKSERWSFGSNADDGLVFDITDDGTGELSDLAENNILVYVNETNGTEVPTVFAREDPEGAVHYYLGHSTSGNGRLLIPNDGNELELKVDYGRKYESVRVRIGYSRLSGKQLQIEKEKASTYEKDMLNELNTITTEEVFDAQLFLEKLNSTWSEAATDIDSGANGRALLVTLVLLRRALVIINEERNDNIHLDLVQSLRDLALQFFDRFDFATNRSLILDNEMYSEILSTTLKLRVIKTIGDNTHSIRNAIKSLV